VKLWSLSGGDPRWFKRSTRLKGLWQETSISYNNNNNNNNTCIYVLCSIFAIAIGEEFCRALDSILRVRVYMLISCPVPDVIQPHVLTLKNTNVQEDVMPANRTALIDTLDTEMQKFLSTWFLCVQLTLSVLWWKKQNGHLPGRFGEDLLWGKTLNGYQVHRRRQRGVCCTRSPAYRIFGKTFNRWREGTRLVAVTSE